MLSNAQRKIVDRMKAGESLSYDQKIGRYVMKKNGVASQIDQRPVLVMIRDGSIRQDLGGSCHLSI